ncbi:MAG: DUF3341 domain-containing protein [Bdellovibrionales bacterium]|nr:DUF3341 domain-containing protein [Bdellovibrionales bacterium]
MEHSQTESIREIPETMKPGVSGLFSAEIDVVDSINQLKNKGFSVDDMSILYSAVDPEQDLGITQRSKASEGATLGGTTGLLAGGTFGWMAGAGSISLPGTGLLIASGPLMAMLAGAGVVAAVGGVVGALLGLGLTEYEAKGFAERIEKGDIVLSVIAETSRERRMVADVFEMHNCQRISDASQKDG